MKKHIIKGIALLLFISFAHVSSAQRGGGKRERIESMKIAFITKRLDLTPAEAKTFWPVYNQFQDEMETLHKSHRENLADERRNFDSLSDGQIEKLVDAEISTRQQELDVVKKYLPQFKKILPIRKVGMLFRAEEDFKRKLLDMLQDRKDDKREERRDDRRMDRQPNDRD